MELLHAPDHDGVGYAVVPVNGHLETWPARSRVFRQSLGREYWLRHHKVASSQAMQDALNVIAGKAIYHGVECPVAVRVAAHSGDYYLDLANPSWQAARVTAGRWEVVDRPSVRFIRPNAMLSLPAPVTGGSVDELRQLINVPHDDAWALPAPYMIQAIRPTLCWSFSANSAKSTLCRLVRGLIDPNKAPLRAKPREERDLMIAANNGWIIAYDNLSRVSPQLSDALRRLSTGGGFATRELYSDDEERIFQVIRLAAFAG